MEDAPTSETGQPVTGQLGQRVQPKQERALTTRQKLLDAAAAVIERVGVERFTTGQIVAEAGVSVGIFYRYFSDRVALLDALYPDRVTFLSGIVTLGALDGSDDAASWLSTGHVLDAYEVEFLRDLFVRR